MSSEDLISEIIRAQQLCESLAVRYAADLMAFDDENETDMAARFVRGVLVEVQGEEYPRAVTGLDRFVADFLDNDPLMRIDFGGLVSVLRPVLVILASAQQNGLDTED